MIEGIRYDVFLSHNSGDKRAVETIAHRLREEAHLEPFLDKWHLIPGAPWQEALEEALERSKTVAVFVGPSGISPWHNEEMRTALDHAVRRRDEYRVIPVLLPGATEAAVTRFLARRTWVDFRSGLDDADAFARLVAGILGRPPKEAGAFTLPDKPAPYPGLQPFTAQQEAFFFGRTDERKGLLERVQESSFVAVVGASGSGKSSLVLAGLLPRLEQDWRALTLFPGTRPLRALADQLATLAPMEGRLRLADDLEARLAERADGLSTAASTFLADRPDIATLLIVVDQFEELFTQVAGTPEEAHKRRRQLIANLVDTVQTSGGRVRVVLALRADFVRHCLDFPDLRALLQANQLLLGPMGKRALREAIVQPAQAVGAMFEKGLVARIVGDMRDQPAALPLMQSALAQLWQRRHGVWLTHAAYEAIGGVSGAIDQRAEVVYNELSKSQKHLARNLFVRLVALGEDTSDTRRRVRREELNLVGVAAEDMEELISTLSRGGVRLIVADEDTVELAHEALIEQWERLRSWLQEDRATLHIHQELTKAAQQWEQHGRDASYLYRGSRLAKVEQWTETPPADLSTLEHDFIIASIAARRAELATHRQRKVLRIAVFGLSTLVVIALVALLINRKPSTGSWDQLGEMRAHTLAVDPAVPDTLYVGTVEENGGVLKSSDGGQTWTRVLTTSSYSWVNVTLSPHTAGTLYAGARESTNVGVKGTMFRSYDDGEHWINLGTVLDASGVEDLVVDPLIAKTLYVCDAVHSYVYRSTDSGTSWITTTIAPDGQAITALTAGVIDEATSVLYVGSEGGRLWHSTNQGASWQNDFPDSPPDYIIDMVMHPADANVLYALTRKGLYCIQTGVAHGQPLVSGFEGLKLAVDPLSPDVVFVSVVGGKVFMVQAREGQPSYQQVASTKDFHGSSLMSWLLASDLAAADRAPYYLYAATEKGLFGWEPSPQIATQLD